MLIDFLTQANYLPLIIGLFVGGTPALVAAMFLVVSGDLDIKVLVTITVICTLVWDTIWYAIGRFIPIEKVEKWSVLKDKEALYHKYYQQYDGHKHTLLFISRFVYGMNSILSIICGIFRMRFPIFIFLSFSSMVVWIAVIYYLSEFFQTNAEVLGIADNFSIFLPLFLILMLVVTWLIKKVFYRYIAK